ncbi:MAG: hypothetical protein N2249_00930, partial [Melioribacter sp.]|nr:hypothetical protein [Melioribacter sp.]
MIIVNNIVKYRRKIYKDNFYEKTLIIFFAVLILFSRAPVAGNIIRVKEQIFLMEFGIVGLH